MAGSQFKNGQLFKFKIANLIDSKTFIDLPGTNLTKNIFCI